MPPVSPVSDSLTVLVYSSNPVTREKVRMSLGRRPAPDVARLEYVECETGDAVIDALDAGGIDLAILDGEATPSGGIGLSRQVKNELRNCPPILLLIGRRDDRWLAHWSQTDAAVPHPIDAIELAEVTAELLRRAGSRAGHHGCGASRPGPPLTMAVTAWCGRCGESFPLLEVVESTAPEQAGHCPRCGVALAPEYAAVLVSAVRQVLAAASVLEASGAQLADVAPLLHIDRGALAEGLESSLDH